MNFQTELRYVEWLQESISVLWVQLVITAPLASLITHWWMWKMGHLVKAAIWKKSSLFFTKGGITECGMMEKLFTSSSHTESWAEREEVQCWEKDLIRLPESDGRYY